MAEPLQEETQLSVTDLKVKVAKLNGYIKRSERRIATLEKKLAKVEEKMRLKDVIAKRKVMA